MDINQSLFSLHGKVVIVTGGSGMTGLEAVKQLPLYGARVVVGVRNVLHFENKIQGTIYPKDIQKPLCYELDIGENRSVKKFIQKVVDKFGCIDGLVNNAFPRTSDWQNKFEDVTPESLYKNLCDHAGGYFLCCQQAGEVMKQQKKGVILNVGSIYGVQGPHFPIYENTAMTSPATYALIKGGIHTFTKHLAAYFAPKGIRVNCLSPGGIQDEEQQDPEFIKNYIKQTPMGRMGKPQDVVGPMIFLLSDASQYVTGEILFVDGGWTVW